MASGWDGHLDEDQAERYSMGVLSEQEEARLEEHLLVCENCRRQVTDADEYAGAMRSACVAIEEKAAREPKRGWLVSRPAWALAAAVVLAAGLFLFLGRSNVAPVAVQLAAVRGGHVGAVAPAGAPLILFADTNGLPQAGGYRLEIVDAVGGKVWEGAFQAGGVQAPRQDAGVYFVRLKSSSGEVLREYGLEVSKTPAVSNVPR